MRIGFMFWLFIFFNIQFFFGSLYLSPVHARGAIVVAFVLSVSMCFAAGGVETARLSSQSEKTLREDWLVKVYRSNNEISVEPKKLEVPLPFINKVFQRLE